MKPNMQARLTTVMKAMTLGMEITLDTGHKMVWAEEEDAPGFLLKRYYLDKAEDVIMQIGSETSWMFLIDYAKNLTEEKFLALAADMALNEMKVRR